MEDKQAFSELEIIGIAAAAAAALGGIVIGLGRGQARMAEDQKRSERSLERVKSLDRDQVAQVVSSARQEFEGRYPQLRDSVLSRAEQARSRMQDTDVDRSKATGWGKEIRDLVATVAPQIVATAKPLISSSRKKISQTLSDTEGSRDEARARLRESGETLSKNVRDEYAPAARERSRKLVERARHAVEDIADRSSESRSSVEALRDRGANAAQSVAHSSTSAAKETAATVAWLSLGSAIVYLTMLSPERREQVKSAVCSGFEQVRLLALDLRGYEPET